MKKIIYIFLVFIGLTSIKNGGLRASTNFFPDSAFNTVTSELFTQTSCMHHDAVNELINYTDCANLFFDEDEDGKDEKSKTSNVWEIKCVSANWSNASVNNDWAFPDRSFQKPSPKLFILNSVFRL